MRVLLFLFCFVVAFAQDAPMDAELMALGAPSAPPATEMGVDLLTEEISSGLRCPVCQGMPVSESPSETAVTWKNTVRDLVEQGYQRGQIEQFFVNRHGEWALLKPRAQGFNWVLWLAPGMLLGGGLVLSLAYANQWRGRPDDELSSDLGETPKDPYEARLLAELED